MENKTEINKKKKRIDLDSLSLAICTILLGIAYFIGAKTNWFDNYLFDFGEIDLEIMGWGIFNLSLTIKDLILVGGMLLLGVLYIVDSDKKKKKQEDIQIYIEDSNKEQQKESKE